VTNLHVAENEQASLELVKSINKYMKKKISLPNFIYLSFSPNFEQINLLHLL